MIVKIYEQDLEQIAKVITRYKKLADKFGGTISFEIQDTVYEELEIDGISNIYKFYEVEVEGCVKINDWELVALIDDVGETKNRVRLISTSGVDGETVNMFHSVSITCEHCNTNRRRLHSAFVRNIKTKELKQVGLNCLKLYTDGLSAQHAALYGHLFDKIDELSDLEYRIGCYSSSYQPLFPVEKVISASYSLIHLTGFKSVSAVENGEYEVPTRDEIIDVIRYRDESTATSYLKKLVSDFREDLKYFNHQENIQPIIDYYRAEPDIASSYLVKLHKVFLTHYVTENDFGLIAAGVNGWIKYMNEKALEKKLAENSISEFLGNSGDKLVAKIHDVQLISTCDSIFGTSFLYKFHDDFGNELTWWSSRQISNIDCWVGKTMRCSVKSHDEYKGIKQTVVTRCKLIH